MLTSQLEELRQQVQPPQPVGEESVGREPEAARRRSSRPADGQGQGRDERRGAGASGEGEGSGEGGGENGGVEGEVERGEGGSRDGDGQGEETPRQAVLEAWQIEAAFADEGGGGGDGAGFVQVQGIEAAFAQANASEQQEMEARMVRLGVTRVWSVKYGNWSMCLG